MNFFDLVLMCRLQIKGLKRLGIITSPLTLGVRGDYSEESLPQKTETQRQKQLHPKQKCGHISRSKMGQESSGV